MTPSGVMAATSSYFTKIWTFGVNYITVTDTNCLQLNSPKNAVFSPSIYDLRWLFSEVTQKKHIKDRYPALDSIN